MGFRNPAKSPTFVATAATAQTLDTRDATGAGLRAYNQRGGSGAYSGVVEFDSSLAGETPGTLADLIAGSRGADGGFSLIANRRLRLAGGSVPGKTYTAPWVDQVVENSGGTWRSRIDLHADTISGAGSDLDWHVVGDSADPLAPVFANSWTNYTSATEYGPTRFRRHLDGSVELAGLVQGGTPSTTLPVFTLPAGYRPTQRRMFAVVGNNATGRLDVTTTGQVLVVIGSTIFTSLNVPRFSTA